MSYLVTGLVGLAALVAIISPTGGICAYLVTITIRPNELFEGVLLPSIPIMIIVMSLSYMLHLGSALPRPAGRPSRTSALMVAMVVLLLCQLLIFRTDEVVGWILSEAAPLLLLLLFLTRHMSTVARLRTTLVTMTAGAAYAAIDALVVHFFRRGPAGKGMTADGIPFVSHGALWDAYHLEGRRLHGNISSIWGNPNDFGMLCNWGIVGSLYFLRRKGSKPLLIASLALIAVFAIDLFLTGSRGGLLQLGVTLWIVFVGGRRKVLGMFLLVTAIVGVLVVLPRFSPERSDEGASKDERTELLLAGLRLFKAYPVLGVGYLNFPVQNDFKSLLPHNVYIQCLAETGLVGSAIFFTLIYLLRRETSRAVKHFEGGADPKAAKLARCIGALQASFCVFMLFSNQFMRFTFGLVMSLAIGLHLAHARGEQETSESPAAAAGAGRVAGTGVSARSRPETGRQEGGRAAAVTKRR